ncbi:response regulator [Clostridium sp. BJN0001]|uniref:response regulator n=1 Tax=Clostridium sp. BJN0001 TaxID=2930219 RepID=UPI001FD12E6F|nr:response regulator [Clostridium sp. BJN0001]
MLQLYFITTINPDYAFLDLLMPKLNGQELLKLIKEFNKDAKIFIVSADVQKSIRTEVEKNKIMGFINKPFNEEKAKLISEMIRKDFNE